MARDSKTGDEQTVNPGQFKPGESGNPKGRPPRGTSLAEIMRTHWTPEKIRDETKRLYEKAKKVGDVRTAQHILEFVTDRTQGRAPLTIVDIPIPDEATPIDWGAVPLERRRRLMDALAEADGIALPDDDETT